MSREWKPGDVVIATVMGRPNVRLIAGWSKYDPQLRWGELSTRWADGDDDGCWFMPSQVTDARRLVVIDPEDRKQLERLAAWQRLNGGGHPYAALTAKACKREVDALQAAFRALANPTPPKPDEPTGLGAVVEAVRPSVVDRALLTRTGVPSERCWIDASEDFYLYRELTDVKVLSDGVTP